MSYSVTLTAEFPEELQEEFLKKICYVSDALADYELIPGPPPQVRFQLRPGEHGRFEIVAKGIQEVAEKLSYGYRPTAPKVLASGRGKGSFSDDPHKLLFEQGDLFKYGEGRFGLGPRLCAVINVFERGISEIARQLQAIPHRFPSLIGGQAMYRCRYIKSFPSSLTFVNHLKEDLAGTQEFARNAKWEERGLSCDSSYLSAIQCLLSPNVCFHWYAWLAGTCLKDVASVTAVGKCFRYESLNLTGLERLWDFTMHEIIFAGPRDYVLDRREKTIELTLPWLERWGLAYEVKSAADPFFVEDFAAMANFQLAFDLKFELLTPLTYRRKNLAVGSFNYHQDFFGKAFEITTPSGDPVHTACAGYGLERLLLAFLAQHGTDARNWPADFR